MCNDDNANEAPLLEFVKENGENSRHKLNQKERVEKKNNTKGVETRSSKKDQQTKAKPLASTLDKYSKIIDQHSKVKMDVGSPDKPGRRTTKKTRELESM